MTSFKRFITAAVVAVLGTALIAGPAAAHGGKRHKAELRNISATNLVNAAATQLGTTPAALTTAITNAANTEIDEMLADEDISAERAAKLKAKVATDIRKAMKLSRTRVVAANLGITTQVLNQKFRDARRALATARIDQALADGKITAEEAATLKARLAAAKLPGYSARYGFCFNIGGFRDHKSDDHRGDDHRR